MRSMKSNPNLGRHKDLESPDIPELIMPSEHQRHVGEKAVDELSTLVILFGYVWVVFEWLSVNKGIVLSEYHMHYPEFAFAIINSLVFAKVLLMPNCMWDFVVTLSRHATSLWLIVFKNSNQAQARRSRQASRQNLAR
jgi:hypothetical protein